MDGDFAGAGSVALWRLYGLDEEDTHKKGPGKGGGEGGLESFCISRVVVKAMS